MSTLTMKDITKRYGTTVALNSVTVTLEPERIYGLLGRNGAGKTTLLNILTSRIYADEGEILLDGTPTGDEGAHQNLVYMMSEANLYPDGMRVLEAFGWARDFMGGFDMAKGARLAEEFGLKLNKRFRQLSTGYRTIFKIIIALCVDRPFIVLDEPVLGLDAGHRDLFYREILSSYAQSPRTYILSTHLIGEVSHLLEDVIMIDRGNVIRQQPVEELLAMGYSVSGKAGDVDAYVAGKQLIDEESLGGLKTAYLMGEIEKAALPDTLEVGKLDLQKLFVLLTK